MIHRILFAALLTLSSLISQSSWAQDCDGLFAQEPTPVIAPIKGTSKIDINLERLLAETASQGTDLSMVTIKGILRTNLNVTSESHLIALFQDPSVKINVFLTSATGHIVTFRASLRGVLNVALSPDVLSIQMSQQGPVAN